MRTMPPTYLPTNLHMAGRQLNQWLSVVERVQPPQDRHTTIARRGGLTRGVAPWKWYQPRESMSKGIPHRSTQLATITTHTTRSVSISFRHGTAQGSHSSQHPPKLVESRLPPARQRHSAAVSHTPHGTEPLIKKPGLLRAVHLHAHCPYCPYPSNPVPSPAGVSTVRPDQDGHFSRTQPYPMLEAQPSPG